MNKINYHQRMLSQVAQVNKTQDRLLLHTCCAPCLTQSLVVFSQYFDNITVYYSNDNITDLNEWDKRYQEIIRLVDIVNNNGMTEITHPSIQLVAKPLNTTTYYDTIVGYEGDKEGGQRCHLCYNMRIEDSYNYARDNNYNYHTTTLTISPYKNSGWINTIGLCYSDDKCQFLCSDLKKNDGYKKSIELSNTYQLYRQHYCGCPFSIVDPALHNIKSTLS